MDVQGDSKEVVRMKQKGKWQKHMARERSNHNRFLHNDRALSSLTSTTNFPFFPSKLGNKVEDQQPGSGEHSFTCSLEQFMRVWWRKVSHSSGRTSQLKQTIVVVSLDNLPWENNNYQKRTGWEGQTHWWLWSRTWCYFRLKFHSIAWVGSRANKHNLTAVTILWRRTGVVPLEKIRTQTGLKGQLYETPIEIRYDKMLSLARSTSALLLQPGLDILHNHDDIMIMYLIFLSPYLWHHR